LSDWERNGWLVAHRTSANEIRDLLAVVERDLADSAAEGLSADGGRTSRTTRPWAHGAEDGALRTRTGRDRE
jgi:hypothetical protein